MKRIVRLPVDFARIKGDYKDLTALLKEAQASAELLSGIDRKKIIHPSKSIKDYMLARINLQLIKERLINASMFHCALYVSGLIERTAKKFPDSLFAVDYFEKGLEEENPFYFQEGADVCFFICVFFEKWGSRRAMRLDDYFSMGQRLYSMYYEGSNQMIGWHMSMNFREMSAITKVSIQN